MILTGIIMFIIGLALMKFLEPKEDVRIIQLHAGPKIATLLLTFGGILVFVIGIIMLIF